MDGFQLLQNGIDISVQETTPGQRLLAWTLILAIAFVAAYLLYRTQYRGLPSRLAKAKADLTGARADTTLQSVYIPQDVAENPDRVAEIVNSVLDDDPPDQPTLRGAAGSVRTELAQTWAPRWLALPPAARRVLGLGAVVLVFGAVAVSTESLLSVLETSEPQTQPEQWPVLAVTETLAMLGTAAGWIASAPGADVVWALALTAVLTVGTWLYTHWYVVALVLFVGSTLLIWLERRLPDTHRLWAIARVQRGTKSARALANYLGDSERSEQLVPDSAQTETLPVAQRSLYADSETPPPSSVRWLRSLPRSGQVARVIIVAMLACWVIGLVSVGIGRVAVDPNERAVRYGAAAMLAAASVFGLAAVIAVARNWDRLAAVPRRCQRATPRQQTYLIARAAVLLFTTLVSPLVPVYIAVGLTKFPRLIDAYLAASAGIQALGAVVILGIAVGLAYQARAAWGDVRSALRISAAQTSVRGAVAAQGAPIVVVGVTYALTAGLFRSIILGVICAVAAGLLARQAISLLSRARYRVSMRDRSPQPALRVVVEGAALETRDGDREWYVRVNGGTELLHPDRERVVEDSVAVVSQLVADGTTAATLSEWHAEDAFEYGVTDPAETKRKLFEDTRRVIFRELRKHMGTVPTDRLEDRLADIPDPIVERRFYREEYGLGTITCGDDYTTLERDPYRRDGPRQHGGQRAVKTLRGTTELAG